MNKTNRHILFLVLVITLLAFSTSVVFAKELGLLTISGPGIKGEVSLNDHDAMMSLEQSGFLDQAVLSKPPKDLDLGKGYNVTAHLNLDGKLVPFIQMVYYPTEEGQSAYVHYTGRLEGETLQTIDEWHILNRKTDSVLRDLMTANNIAVESTLIKAPAAVAPAKEPVAAPVAEPATAPAVPSAPIQTPYIISAVVASILLLAGAGFVLRRRAASQQTT